MKKTFLPSTILAGLLVGIIVLINPNLQYGQEDNSFSVGQDKENWKSLRDKDETLVSKFMFRALSARYKGKKSSFESKRYKQFAETRSKTFKRLAGFFSTLKDWVNNGNKIIKKVNYNNLTMKPTHISRQQIKFKDGKLSLQWPDVLNSKKDIFYHMVDRQKLSEDQLLSLGMLILETTGDGTGQEVLSTVINRSPKFKSQVKNYFAMRKEQAPKNVKLSSVLTVKKKKKKGGGSSGYSNNSSRSYFNKERLHKKDKKKHKMVKGKRKYTVRQRILMAAEYLRRKQNQDGSFGGDKKGVGGVGMKVAITSLVAKFVTAATLVYKNKNPYNMTWGDIPSSLRPMLVAALKYLFPSNPENREKRPPKLQDAWESVYRIEYIAYLWDMPMMKEYRGGMAREFKRAVKQLEDRQMVPGGWGYYQKIKQGMAFASAAAILALTHALSKDIDVDEKIMDTVRQMKKDALDKIQTTFKVGPARYMYRPGTAAGENRKSQAPRGTLMEMAQLYAGAPTGDLELAVDNFFKYRSALEDVQGRKGTHVGTGKMAPYYYLYHHYYTSRGIRHYSDPEQRLKHMEHMRRVIIEDQREDGSFYDAPALEPYTTTYGTAFGGLVLYNYARNFPKNAKDVHGGDGGGSGGGGNTGTDR